MMPCTMAQPHQRNVEGWHWSFRKSGKASPSMENSDETVSEFLSAIQTSKKIICYGIKGGNE